MNSFILLLLETLGITEEQTIAISKVMDTYNIQPNILRDVLQPATKGEKVGDTLLPIMQFKALEKTCKQINISTQSFTPHTKNGVLYIGENETEQPLC
ncbi:MAG: hypothetical protein J6X18_13715 [Bacteroidales bacterium]|nr:hypothetical protein [Bacteroidales bacterium]